MGQPTRSPITPASAACLGRGTRRRRRRPPAGHPVAGGQRRVPERGQPPRGTLRSRSAAWTAQRAAFIAAALTVATLFREHHRRLPVIGAALAVAGAVGLACVYLASLIAGQMARLDDHDVMVALADRVSPSRRCSSSRSCRPPGAIGSVTLAMGIYRSRAVPRAAAVLVGVGGATIMITAAGPVSAAVAGSAVIALTGFAWVAATSRAGTSPHQVPLTVAAPVAAGQA